MPKRISKIMSFVLSSLMLVSPLASATGKIKKVLKYSTRTVLDGTGIVAASVLGYKKILKPLLKSKQKPIDENLLLLKEPSLSYDKHKSIYYNYVFNSDNVLKLDKENSITPIGIYAAEYINNLITLVDNEPEDADFDKILNSVDYVFAFLQDKIINFWSIIHNGRYPKNCAKISDECNRKRYVITNNYFYGNDFKSFKQYYATYSNRQIDQNFIPRNLLRTAIKDSMYTLFQEFEDYSDSNKMSLIPNYDLHLKHTSIKPKN